ncbi:MAG: nuclear transport factor 2 family protein [Fidelibacterota bacterium]|nr:MAG: nuclear transport factor 2 family protein [Candidatus Neomarinimicrobiota bacterium]
MRPLATRPVLSMVIVSVVLLAANGGCTNMANQSHEEIKSVIEAAYIQGIHGDQDEGLIRGGFHEEFNMLVRADNTIEKVSVDDWLTRIEGMKEDNPDLWTAEASHQFKLIDVAGYAAVAILDVYRGEVHFSTDYMLLYRFDEGWRIVSKIFAIPQG